MTVAVGKVDDPLDGLSAITGRHRYFDRAGRPMGLVAWGEAFNDVERRVLARDDIAGRRVVTVWLGYDSSESREGAALIFGSIIQVPGEDAEETLYATEAEARQGHVEIVARLRRAEEGRYV